MHGRGQGRRRTLSVDHQHRRLLSQILLIAHCLPHRSSLEYATRVPLLRLRGCRMQRVQREPRKWLEVGVNSTVNGVGLVRGARGRPEGQICAQHQQVSGTVCQIFYANNHTNKSSSLHLPSNFSISICFNREPLGFSIQLINLD